jgi:NAD(P)-dependent dehydrogenase (short-subunit alcohol dehydrogenase family)
MTFLVTGGSRGIGRGIVLDAAAAGQDVAFTYVSRPDLAETVLAEARKLAPDRQVKAYQLNVADSAAVEEVIDTIGSDFETIDCIVNNAGINRPGLAMAMSDEDWSDVLDVNLSGAFYVVRATLPLFLASGGGSYVHISSIATYGITGQLSYCASKAGLLGLSAGIAREYGKKKVRSNVLMLGLFESDMVREGLSKSNREFWLQYCPAGRFGEIREISAACLYLASENSGFITGQVITLTGGLEHAP